MAKVSCQHNTAYPGLLLTRGALFGVFFKSYFYFMCMSVSPECTGIPHARCLQRMLDPVELKLQVSSHVGAGNKIPCKASKPSRLLSNLSSPYACFSVCFFFFLKDTDGCVWFGCSIWESKHLCLLGCPPHCSQASQILRLSSEHESSCVLGFSIFFFF